MKKRKLRLRKETFGRLNNGQMTVVAGATDTTDTVGQGVCTAESCVGITNDTCINCGPGGNTIPPTQICSAPPTVCNTCFPTVC